MKPRRVPSAASTDHREARDSDQHENDHEGEEGLGTMAAAAAAASPVALRAAHEGALSQGGANHPV
jgi:hypothetical protein